jgi:hypothetical protein
MEKRMSATHAPKRGLKTLLPLKPKESREAIRSEIATHIDSLKSIWKGLGRKPKAIYTYLCAVYGVAARLKELKEEPVLEAVSSLLGQPLDRRLGKSSIRLLLAITCESDTKMQSRYANALKYARKRGCAAINLQEFIESHGGIQACARAWSRRTGSQP